MKRLFGLSIMLRMVFLIIIMSKLEDHNGINQSAYKMKNQRLLLSGNNILQRRERNIGIMLPLGKEGGRIQNRKSIRKYLLLNIFRSD